MLHRRRRVGRGAVRRAHPAPLPRPAHPHAAAATPWRAHPAEHDLGVERGL